MDFALRVVVLLMLPGLASADSFLPLGQLPGGSVSVGITSRAFGVSADGSVVVGDAYIGDSVLHAFRWTSDGGMVDITPDNYLGQATGVSADGAVVTGTAGFSNDSAFRWTSNGGLINLGGLPGNMEFSNANAVSDNGNVIVGWDASDGVATKPFRWTPDSGMENLNIGHGIAFGVSGDGNVVVGRVYDDQQQSFRWTAEGGVVGLGSLPGGSGGTASDASFDGTVIVGNSPSSEGQQAFRWTSEGGMAGLGFLAGGHVSMAASVSGDGAVVVGVATSALGGEQAFIWTQSGGMRSLFDVLVANGIDLAGWNLVEATDISNDGRWIVGSAINPAGVAEAFLANISPVPIPSAVWLFGSALGLMGLMRRKVSS